MEITTWYIRLKRKSLSLVTGKIKAIITDDGVGKAPLKTGNIKPSFVPQPKR